MRYRKGAIDASSTQDRHVLEHIVRAQFITHSQLWQLLHARCYEISRDSFGWRMRRLVRHGLVTEQHIASVSAERIYSVSAEGVIRLQDGTTFYADTPATAAKRSNNHPHIAHAVGVNKIHERLLKTGLLVDWMWESEIRAANDFTTTGFRKDYDAIAGIYLSGQVTRFALEYERSAKTSQAYHAILGQIEKEGRVGRFLYLVNGDSLRSFLMQNFFRRSNRSIYIGMYEDLWKSDPRHVPIVHGATWESMTLDAIPAFEASHPHGGALLSASTR